MSNRDELDRKYASAKEFAGSMGDPLFQLRDLMEVFIIGAGLHPDEQPDTWLDGTIPITLVNNQTMEPEDFSVTIAEAYASLFVLSNLILQLKPEAEAHALIGGNRADLMASALNDITVTRKAAIYFGTPVNAYLELYTTHTAEIKQAIAEKDILSHCIIAEGALSWALKHPADNDLLAYFGVHKDLPTLDPLSQDMVIAELVNRSMTPAAPKTRIPS